LRNSINGEDLNKKPVDPIQGTEYTYSRLAYGNAYQIKAELENDFLKQTIYIEDNHG
jgi:hypothetical protein